MTTQILTPQKLKTLLAAPISSKSAPAGLTSPILDLFTSADRDLLAKMMTEHHYLPGTVIFKEGDVGDAMYVIRSGQVVVVQEEGQLPTILGYRGVGEIVGEMALLENKPRFASVVAIEEVDLLRISRKDFEALRQSNPDFEISMAQALSARLRAADEARSKSLLTEKKLSEQISELQTEKQQLLELQRLRQETSDFIVHDLRSPLSLIAGAMSLLEMVLPEEVLQSNHEILELAHINCQRLKRLIDSLLDIARLETGETELLLTLLNLSHLINNTVEQMMPSARIKTLTLITAIPPDLPLVEADEQKIDRVLENLIDNAIKFTPARGQIVITAEARDEHILIRVVNTGPTIPPLDRERIFDRFAQLSGDSTRTHGSGLGLAFCRLAVEAHGGRIWVEPGHDGEGNCFVFNLPLSVQPQPSFHYHP
jgi:signal transduction histidine kinase